MKAEIVMAVGPVIRELSGADMRMIVNQATSPPLTVFTIRPIIISKSLRIGLLDAMVMMTRMKTASLYPCSEAFHIMLTYHHCQTVWRLMDRRSFSY